MTDLRPLDVRIPRDLYDRLNRLARDHHQHRAEFLREKLAEVAGVAPEKIVRRDYGPDKHAGNHTITHSGIADWYGIGVVRQRTRDAVYTLKEGEG